MPASNVCWGIEVGAGAVKAIKVEREGDATRVVDFAIVPHKQVLSTPELNASDAARVAIGQLVSQHDLSKATIAISVPGHSAFARFAKLPPVEAKKVPDIVKFEAVQQIPFPIEEVEWDYQTFKSDDSPDIEVGIFAMKRDRIMESLALWSDVGVTPDYVTLSPVAAFNALAWDMQFTEKTPGTVILDVGTTSTDLVVAEAGRVWVRTFPIGGHQFTDALVEAFKLSYSKAEKLKREAEQSKHARHVFQAMRPIFGDLAQDVQRSIGYYQSLHRDANLTRLVALGSTFALPGLRKYLGQQLQMEIITVEKYSRLTVEGPRADEFNAAAPTLATAYGLALQGLGFSHGIMANLMPRSILRRAMWQRKAKWFAVAAGLVLAAGGATFLRPLIDSTKVESNPKPEVIQQVKSKLTSLRRDYKEMTDAFESDYWAANLVPLVEDRDVIPSLVTDLGAMVNSAQTLIAAEGPDAKGITFMKFEPKYGTTAASTDDQPAANDGQDDGGRGAAPAAPSDPYGDGQPAEVGVIRCTLSIKTSRKEPDKFVRDTFMKWLRENAARESAPYTVKATTIEFKIMNRETIQGGPAGAAPPPSPANQEPDPGVGLRPRGKGGGASPGGGDPPGQDDRPPPPPSGFAPPPPPTGRPVEFDPERIAPFPAAPPFAKPGETLTTIDIVWEVQLKKVMPKQEVPL